MHLVLLRSIIPFFLIAIPLLLNAQSGEGRAAEDNSLTGRTAAAGDARSSRGASPGKVVGVGEDSAVVFRHTGAVTVLADSSFNDGNIYDPYALIQGRAPGLLLSKPGGDPLGRYEVQLRGRHAAFYHDANLRQRFPMNEAIDLTRPLLVVDGLPQASLLSVDPEDIASITILRDAASSSAFGVQGANGVILIRTREGAPGPPRLTYGATLAVEGAARTPEVLSAAGFRGRVSNPAFLLGGETDWIDAITRTAFSQAHHLGLSGGSEHTRYRIGLHFRDQEGIALTSGFRQYSGQASLRQRFWGDRLDLGVNLAYLRRDGRDVTPFAFRAAATFNPTAPVRDASQSPYGGYVQQNIFMAYNPVAMLEQTRLEQDQQVRTAGFNLGLRVIDGLTLRGRYGFQRQDETRGEIYPRDAFYLGAAQNGLARRRERQLDQHLAEGLLEYERRAGRHALTLSGAITYQRFDYRGEDLSGSDFAGVVTFGDLGTPAATNRTGERRDFRSRDELAGLLARATYAFDDTYFLTAGLRRDAASRFGGDYGAAWFPSLGGAVALNRLLDWNGFDAFRFRLAYGEAGQLPPKNYAAWTLLEPGGSYPQDGVFRDFLSVVNTPNSRIGPERRREWTAGLDLALAGGRLRGSIDWYDSRSSDLIFSYDVPSPPNIAPRITANYAEMSNRGLELSLQADAIDKTDYGWTVDMQLSHNRTRFERLTDPLGKPFPWEVAGSPGAPGLCCVLPLLVREGQPLGQFYGPRYEGVDENGRWIFADLSGDGPGFDNNYSENTVIGNAQPDLHFGIGNRLRYGRLNLDFLLRGVLGHDLLSTADLFYGLTNNLGTYNVLREAITPDRQRISDVPVYSSFYVQNASFLRLEYVTLGYDLDVDRLRFLSRLQTRLTVQNLFTLTGYSDTDPQPRLTYLGDGNPLAPGIDGPNVVGNTRGFYFPVRSVVLSIQASF